MARNENFEPVYCYDAKGNAYLIGGGPATPASATRRAVCATERRPVGLGRRSTSGRARP